MRKIQRLNIGVLAAVLIQSTVFAGEVLSPASVFEEPSEASRQVAIVQKGQQIRATGMPERHDGRRWTAVEIDGKPGWIESDALRATAGDPAFSSSFVMERGSDLPRMRYWAGLGPTLLSGQDITVAGTRYQGTSHGGAAFGAGVEVLVGSERHWLFGGRIFTPWVAEISPGYGGGRVTRQSFLGTIGYSLTPKKLDLSVHLGFTAINGESSNFDSKLGFTPGLSLTYHISDWERHSLYQAIEFNMLRTEETRGSGAFDIAGALCGAFSNDDPTCVRGVTPTTYVFTLLYKIGFQQ